MKLSTNDIHGLLNILGFQYNELNNYTHYTHPKTHQNIVAYLDESSHNISYLDMKNLEQINSSRLTSFYLGHLQLPAISENILSIIQNDDKPKLKQATSKNAAIFTYFQLRKAKADTHNIPNNLIGIVWWSSFFNSLILPLFNQHKNIVNLLLINDHGHATLNLNSSYYKSQGKSSPSILADPSDIERSTDFFLLIKYFDVQIHERLVQYERLTIPLYLSSESLILNFSLLVYKSFKEYDDIKIHPSTHLFEFSITHHDVTKLLALADKLNNSIRSLSGFKNEDSNKEIAQNYTNYYGIDYYRTNHCISFSIFPSRGNLINFNQACHICNLTSTKFD